VAQRPPDHDPAPSGDDERDFAAANGWDGAYEEFDDFDLPTYVGPATFMKLPWVTDPGEIRRRMVDVAIVGAPFDDAVSHRSGARFGPRAIREAQYTSGSIHSLQLGVEPFEVLTVVDAGDANIVPAWIERAHAFIYRKVREVAATGAIPIVLGGDHSITWPSATAIAEVRRPGSIGIVHFDAHADTASDDWGVLAGHGTPMRRLIESGAVEGSELRPGRPARVLAAGRDVRVDAGAGPALSLHARDRGARRRGGHRDAIAEALDGPDAVYLSIDIDVIDPGMAPGTGTPEPGGMLTREVLRAIRQIVGRSSWRDGHRRGLAAVRPRGDDGDGGEPVRARGDQRLAVEEGRGASGRDGGRVRWES
jgi:agmatinase